MSNNTVSFNLMDRSWLPVTMLDGEHDTVSIMEAFDRAEQIRSIDGDMPLQRFTLTRLLIAILYGAFGNDFDAQEWRELLDSGPQNPEIAQIIHEYCEQYRNRFDLFDKNVPFYQVAGLHTAKNEMFGLERLILDMPSGEPFFVSRAGESLQSMTADEAARWLVTVQAFDASGIKSGAVGDDRVKNGKGYPIGVAWSGHLGGYLIEGQNFWQTLILNFVSQQVLESGDSSQSWDDDSPVWERDPLNEKVEQGFNQPAQDDGTTQYFHGPATLMTWQSRRILLEHSGETVTGALICNGDRLKPQNAYRHEMMTGWRHSVSQERSLKNISTPIYMPQKHDPAKALWRGLPLLTNTQTIETNGTPSYIGPYVIRWLRDTSAQRNMPIRLHAFGVEYGNQEAVIDTVIDDSLDLNLIALSSTNPAIGQMIEESINVVDSGVFALKRMALNIAKAAGLSSDSSANQIQEQAYDEFDKAFRQWIRNVDSDSELAMLKTEWNTTARQLLLRLGNRLAASASPRAIVGRQLTVKDKSTGADKTEYYSASAALIWYRSYINKILPVMKGE